MARNIVTLDNESIRRSAPSVFAEHAAHGRSDRYTYIPTSTVLDGLRKEGFEVTAAMQTRTRIEGNREFTKHMLRLRHASTLDRPMIVGDSIPEIVLVNSHDGTSAYQLMAGIFRLVCSNGMIVGDTSLEVKVRHSGNVVDNVIEGSYEVVENINRVLPVIEDWKRIELNSAERTAYANAALKLRWDEEDGAPVQPGSMLIARRMDDRKPDLWATFNVVQENMLKGGVRGRGRTNRRMTTRAVNGVSENVKLNKALWTLTQAMAEMKMQ